MHTLGNTSRLSAQGLKGISNTGKHKGIHSHGGTTWCWTTALLGSREMRHREPQNAQQNPTKQQEYLMNPSDPSTNPEQSGQPLKTLQKGMYNPAREVGQRRVENEQQRFAF